MLPSSPEPPRCDRWISAKIRIRRRLAAYGAILGSMKDQPILTARIDANGGPEISADQARVPWWSFTKTVIAAGALALVRDGQLALDEPLANRPYSLRQLLQHRAGVTNYGELPAYHDAVARGGQALEESVPVTRVRA